jgi:Ca2+-binding RTX toxin-like protein
MSATVADIRSWNFLENSYWYVPTPYLAAYALLNGDTGTPQTVPLVDQTLWHITKVADGYVFGEVATDLGNGWVYSTLVGSITPTGSVSFSFTQEDSGSDVTVGQGRMVRQGGQWLFEMQMTSGTSSSSVSHWAYMAEAAPGGRASTMLPGYTGTGIAAAFDDDPTNDGGAARPQRIVIGTEGADDIHKLASIAGLLIYGEGGNDGLTGDGRTDGLVGGTGNDRLVGRGAADDLYGQGGNDVLRGGADADLLSGGVGRDRLFGGAGDDFLTGGAGRDILVGGTGRDTFFFDDIRDSAAHRPDVITDFSEADHDRIGFGRIDANTGTATDDAFHFIGTRAFSGKAGELRYTIGANGVTTASADLDGDGQADCVVSVSGEHHFTKSDFML